MNDKIREKFERVYKSSSLDKYDSGVYISSFLQQRWMDFIHGYDFKGEEIKQLENLIRDMLFDIPVIPDRYKYVERLKEIKGDR